MDRPSGVQNYPGQLLPSARSAGVIYLPYDICAPLASIDRASARVAPTFQNPTFQDRATARVAPTFQVLLAHCRGCLNKYQVSIWQTDQNIVAHYLHYIGFNILACRATYYLACMYIELCSVQGTGDYITVKFALAERAANMCAGICKSADITTCICQAHRLAIDFYKHEIARFWYVAQFCYPLEIRHNYPQSYLVTLS